MEAKLTCKRRSNHQTNLQLPNGFTFSSYIFLLKQTDFVKNYKIYHRNKTQCSNRVINMQQSFVFDDKLSVQSSLMEHQRPGDYKMQTRLV